MANVFFFAPYDMGSAQTSFGNITQATSTELAITDGFKTSEYFGSFSYAGNDVFGTLTGYLEFSGTVLTVDVTGLSVDAHVAETYIQSNQLQTIFPIGLAGDDAITGSSGHDVLFGYGGNDRIAGGGGNDTIDGGPGTNTAVYSGNHTDYIIQQVGPGLQITDLRPGSPSGTDHLTHIQQLQFDDGVFSSGLIPQPQALPLLEAQLAVAVEATMYNATGTAAEISSLSFNFLPAQIANAIHWGLNPQVYGCEALGLVFAFGNETGSTAFASNFGPSNNAMPNTAAGDAAFAAAASSTILGGAATATSVSAMHTWVANWEAFYASHGILSNVTPTANQIDLAARGAAWGDMVGVALVDNVGPLGAQVMNFVDDIAQGSAHYGVPLVGQPIHHPFV